MQRGALPLPVACDTQVDLPRVPLLGGIGIPIIIHLLKTMDMQVIDAKGFTFHAGNTNPKFSSDVETNAAQTPGGYGELY